MPYKGKCLRCKGEGHIARNCPIRIRDFNDAQDPPVVDPSGEGPGQSVQNDVSNAAITQDCVKNCDLVSEVGSASISDSALLAAPDVFRDADHQNCISINDSPQG